MKKRGRRTGKDWKIEKNEKKKTDRGFTTTRHPYYPLSIQASSPPSHHSDWPLHQPRRQNPHNNPSFPSSPITEPSPPPGRRCGEILLDILTEHWGSLPSLHSHPSNPGCTHLILAAPMSVYPCYPCYILALHATDPFNTDLLRFNRASRIPTLPYP